MNVGGGGGMDVIQRYQDLHWEDMEHGLMKEKSRMQDNNPQIQ